MGASVGGGIVITEYPKEDLEEAMLKLCVLVLQARSLDPDVEEQVDKCLNMLPDKNKVFARILRK